MTPTPRPRARRRKKPKKSPAPPKPPPAAGAVKASTIVSLLQARHRDEVTATEITLGAAAFEGRPPGKRLDFWAVKTSWSHPHYIGYEVKVTRSDFLADGKWADYMTGCTHFYFACPFGLIEPHELPEGVGLVYVTKAGNALATRRKALYRPISDTSRPVVTNMLKSALMRGKGLTGDDEERRGYWQQWLDQYRGDRQLDRIVGSEIAATLAEKELALIRREKAVALRDREADKKMANADKIEAACEALGVKFPASWHYTEDVTARLKHALSLHENKFSHSESIKRLRDTLHDQRIYLDATRGRMLQLEQEVTKWIPVDTETEEGGE